MIIVYITERHSVTRKDQSNQEAALGAAEMARTVDSIGQHFIPALSSLRDFTIGDSDVSKSQK